MVATLVMHAKATGHSLNDLASLANFLAYLAIYMDFAVCVAPIVILIGLMTKPNGWPSHIALPVTALIVYAIKLIYFADNPNATNATVVEGLLSAWTPIFIISGAILMFKTMERTGAMDIIRRWLNEISDNRVAQLMIVGWAFAFVIEGASGFGTPAALARPSWWAWALIRYASRYYA